MAGALGESFSRLEELEINQIEELASVANLENLTTCSCRGNCLRESGRNFCPCRSLNHYCSSTCHDGNSSLCLNNRRAQESNSDDTGTDTTDYELSLESSESDNEEIGTGTGRGKGRGKRRGKGRGKGRGREQGEAVGEETEVGRRGRGRGREAAGQSGKGAKAGGTRRGGRRGRGQERRNRLDADGAAQHQADQEQQMANLIDGMDIGPLRRLALELLRRQPAAFADIVSGEIVAGDGQPHPDPPQEDIPDWCHCGHCNNMPTQEENKCCARVPRQCITTMPLFPVLILDGNVLDIAMRYREDMMALNNTRNNESFRHAAYRQFVLWQHGRLGKGNRRVVPSCCVIAIRARYPSPNGIYTGYRPSRL